MMEKLHLLALLVCLYKSHYMHLLIVVLYIFNCCFLGEESEKTIENTDASGAVSGLPEKGRHHFMR